MFLYIDKPKGVTSHNVVDRIRLLSGEKRVGHAGTLDPNATGLLIVGVGRESTRKLDGFLKKDKEYEAEIILGEERDTDDIEGKVVKKDNLDKVPTRSEIESVLKDFTGKIKQTPPQYSAIKVGGKPAYKHARKGEKVDLKKRIVNIYFLKIKSYKYPKITITCSVGSGTYIRSLARDIGRKLRIYAYLGNLRRTKIGEISVKQATSLEELEIPKTGGINRYKIYQRKELQ